MTPYRIKTNNRPQDPRHGRIEPMSREDALAWRITRERHPEYYPNRKAG